MANVLDQMIKRQQEILQMIASCNRGEQAEAVSFVEYVPFGTQFPINSKKPAVPTKTFQDKVTSKSDKAPSI
jgi:hypothetical protein